MMSSQCMVAIQYVDKCRDHFMNIFYIFGGDFLKLY